MKIYKLYIIYFLITLLFVGCEKNNGLSEKETYEIDFSFANFAGSTTKPVNNTAYRVVLFNGTNPMSSIDGTYRYDETLNKLVPCTVDEYGIYDPAGSITKMYLQSGEYKLFMLSPAVGLTILDGVSGVLFDKKDPFYISDAKGIKVVGYQVFDIGDVKLIDRRANLEVSMFYEDGVDISVSNAKITNVGQEGSVAFFNITSGYAKRIEGDKSFIFNHDDANNKFSHEAILYASNYSLDYFATPELVFDLTMKGVTKEALRIPLNYEIKPMTTYRLKIDIKSILLKVSFSAQAWGDINTDDSIGGEQNPEITLGSWMVNPWTGDIILEGDIN